MWTRNIIVRGALRRSGMQSWKQCDERVPGADWPRAKLDRMARPEARGYLVSSMV